MANLIRCYGKYRIYNTSTNIYVVKNEDNVVVFTARGLDAAMEWCKVH